MFVRKCKKCRQPFETMSNNGQYCPTCNTKEEKRKRHRDKQADLTTELRSSDRMVLCYCPRCENMHRAKLNWSGHGIPHIYCMRCREDIYDTIYEEAYVCLVQL